MIHSNYISTHCLIKDNNIILNGNNVFSNDHSVLPHDFFKSAFKSLEISYPKFFKMDKLSKLCFLTAEFLLKDRFNFKDYQENKKSVVIQNASSSLDTDYDYYESIRDKSSYFPNPSTFVYTLPNIMIGELCIRHSMKGENILLISRDFKAELLFNVVNDLFLFGKTSCCMAGWVEFKRNIDGAGNVNLNYESFLCLVENNKENQIQAVTFTKENLKLLFR